MYVTNLSSLSGLDITAQSDTSKKDFGTCWWLKIKHLLFFLCRRGQRGRGRKKNFSTLKFFKLASWDAYQVNIVGELTVSVVEQLVDFVCKFVTTELVFVIFIWHWPGLLSIVVPVRIKKFSIDWKRSMCLCAWTRCVTVHMCVWVCYGTVGIPNRRKNRGQKKEWKKEVDTKKLPHERGTFLHLDSLDFTACPAAKPLKIIFPHFLCALVCECIW